MTIGARSAGAAITEISNVAPRELRAGDGGEPPGRRRHVGPAGRVEQEPQGRVRVGQDDRVVGRPEALLGRALRRRQVLQGPAPQEARGLERLARTDRLERDAVGAALIVVVGVAEPVAEQSGGTVQERPAVQTAAGPTPARRRTRR